MKYRVKGVNMRSGILAAIVIVLMLTPALVFSPIPSSDNTPPVVRTTDGVGVLSLDGQHIGDDTDESIIAYFFYGLGCSHCAIVEPYVDRVVAKYPKITLRKLEIFYSSSNQALFQELNARHGVKDPVVPSIFIADEAMIGEDAIKSRLEPTILRLIDSNNEGPPPKDNTTENGTGPPPDDDTASGGVIPSKDLTVAMVVVAALADSINPCALSVMIFLLIFLTSLGNRKRVLSVGVAYIATVYAVYFLAGLGVLTFLQSSAMTRYIYYAAAVLAIIIGLVNIKDYFFFGKGITLAIPESRKPMIKKYIEKASVPAAIVLGSAVSLFELPCTGGIYLAILSLLSNKMTLAEGLPYLALYNAIFVLPLAVILLIFLMGVTAERANSWRLEKRKTLRLILGLVMLVIGTVMILEVL